MLLIYYSVSSRVAISRMKWKRNIWIDISNHWYEISPFFTYAVVDKRNFLAAIIWHHFIRLHKMTTFTIFPALDFDIL